MRFRKILSIVLALCLLTALLPLQTFAAAEPQPVQQGPMYAEMRDSAHYPKIQIQEVTPEPEDAPEESDALWEGTKTYAPTYLSIEEAALKLREYMKARKTSFDLYVKSTNDEYTELVNEMLVIATAHTGKPTEGDYLLWHLDRWGGRVNPKDEGSYNTFHYEVEMTYYSTAAQEKELTTAVNSLLKTLNVKNKSDYEKVKAVYDYICSNVAYDYEHLSDPNYLLMYTAYGALINKTAVCQGYATLLYRLLLELGVDCRVITGQVLTGDPHAWNIAKLGDVYYNLDATFDAETEPDTFFLRNSVMNVTHYRYLDYCSTQFHRDYPMSSTDYVEGVEGVPEHVFASGICGDNAYWTLDWDGLLIINGTGATYDYKEYNNNNLSEAAPWFYWVDVIKTVVVEEGITRLGHALFDGQKKINRITSITFPDSLLEIGNYTFRECKTLTQIRISDGVKVIGRGAFYGCSNLQTVTLGNSLQTINEHTFGNCAMLQEIVLPESVIILKSEAFFCCNALTEVTIPAYIDVANGFNRCSGLQHANIYSIEIGADAFEYCTKLQSVTLSDNLTAIGSRAFWSCVALQEFTIPQNVNYLGDSVFYDTPALTEIYFQGDAPEFSKATFHGATKICYYPAGNPTWTEDVLQQYQGNITWVPYCDHQWSEGSCENPRTCTVCGESSGNDGHIYDDGVDGTCNICGTHRETTEDRTVMHMFRMYDPNSGEHFYTGSEEERDNLVAVGWNYEGVGFTFSMTTGAPVYRLFDPVHGEHLYTMDETERDTLIAAGWNLEGIAFNSAYDTEVPQYRLHNPNEKRGAYHFTASEEERDFLISLGWEYQGIGFYSSWK